MRIVADTNTVVSGLLWQGAPRQIIQACRHQRLTILSCPQLIAELADVLARKKFAARILRAELTPRQLVNDYSLLIEQLNPAPLPTPICRDPDDDIVLACALTGRADAIVSGDADLLTVKAFMGIPILTVNQFLQSAPV